MPIFCLQGDDIPEGTLPEPFNQSKKEFQDMSTIINSRVSPTNDVSVLSLQKPAAASHLSQSFRRSFSKKVPVPPMVPVKAPSLPVSEPCFDQCLSEKAASTSISLSSKPPIHQKGLVSKDIPASSLSSPLLATPVKKLGSVENECSSIASVGVQDTPAKCISTPAKLMTATPTLRPPKRCYMTPDGDSPKSPNKLVRRPQRSRSLKFDTPVKNEHVKEVKGSEDILMDSDIFDLLPENLLLSVSS